MKIGIVTQPLVSNYGGILQAYALQKFLMSLGHDVVTVDKSLINRSLFVYLLSILKRFIFHFVLRKVGNYPVITPFKTRRMKKVLSINTRNFVLKNMNLTVPIKGPIKSSLLSKYSLMGVVVGSDQVWRPTYNSFLENNFLDFVNDNKIKKIAYAASFGVDNWEFSKSQTEKCSRLIKKFDGISTRESSGCNLCDKYLGVKALCVIDPTMLLGKEAYVSLIGNKDSIKHDRQIFTYILDCNSFKDKVSEEISNLLNIPLNSDLSNKLNSGKFTLPPIEEWLRSFYCSEFIITDSFHGTVFSLIFNKPFIVIANEERGIARFTSLLSKFNLEHRLIMSGVRVDVELLTGDLDWESINKIIDVERKLAKDFLDSSLA